MNIPFCDKVNEAGFNNFANFNNFNNPQFLTQQLTQNSTEISLDKEKELQFENNISTIQQKINFIQVTIAQPEAKNDY